MGYLFLIGSFLYATRRHILLQRACRALLNQVNVVIVFEEVYQLNNAVCIDRLSQFVSGVELVPEVVLDL